MADEIGNIWVKLGLDTTGFVNGLKDANKQIVDIKKDMTANFGEISKSFTQTGKAMMAVGTAIVASLGAMVVSYAETGQEMEKLSAKTGFGVESLSELKYAMELTGASFDSLLMASKTMSSAIVDGSKSITRLGLSLTDLKSMKPEQQFDAIVDALRGVQDKTEQVALATDVFGRSAQQLLPYITANKTEIEALKKQAHELGLTFTDESAKAAGDVADKMETLKGALTGIKNTIAKVLLPVISNLITNLTNGLKPILEWIGNNQGMVNMFLGIGVAILGAGGALFAIGKLIPILIALKNAMTAASVAGIFLQGVTGVGLVKVIAGLAGAAIAIGIMNKMTKDATASFGEFGKKVEKEEEQITHLGEQVTQTVDEMLTNFRSLTDTMESLLQDQTSSLKDALDEQLSAESDAHQERLDNLSELEAANLKYLDDQLSLTVDGYQSQIDELDKTLDDESRAEKAARDAKRIADLRAQLAAATTQEEAVTAQKALAEEVANQAADLRRQGLEDAKRALRDQIDAAIKAAAITKQNQLDWWAEKKKAEDASFKNYSDNIDSQKTILDAALAVDKKRYEDDIAAFEKALSTKLTSLEAYVKAAAALQGQITNPAIPGASIPGIDERNTIEFNHQEGRTTDAEYFKALANLRLKYPLSGFASGGIVPGPTGSPQLAIVHGGEKINAVNTAAQGGSSGVNVNVYVAGSVVAERNLAQTVRDEFMKIQNRNVSLGFA